MCSGGRFGSHCEYLKLEKRCRCVDGLCANIYGWCCCGGSLQRMET
jgi:hypothetical protein